MEPSYTSQDALSYGWKAMKDRFWFFFLFLLILLLLSVGASNLVHFVLPHPLRGFGSWLVSALVGMITIWGALRILDGRPVAWQAWKDLFSSGTRLGNFLACQFLYTLIWIGGLVLLIVPAIIWSIQFGFAGFIVLDEGLGPAEALRRSSAITRGFRGELFLFWLLVFAINLLGLLALAVGLFATIPTSMMATAWIYRRLRERDVRTSGDAVPGATPS